ncbi:MAG TPA: hypothetical protein VFG92_09290 [Agromyces sp.]|nr:hypothetical protein [Agromyces sp.]
MSNSYNGALKPAIVFARDTPAPIHPRRQGERPQAPTLALRAADA